MVREILYLRHSRPEGHACSCGLAAARRHSVLGDTPRVHVNLDRTNLGCRADVSRSVAGCPTGSAYHVLTCRVRLLCGCPDWQMLDAFCFGLSEKTMHNDGDRWRRAQDCRPCMLPMRPQLPSMPLASRVTWLALTLRYMACVNVLPVGLVGMRVPRVVA